MTPPDANRATIQRFINEGFLPADLGVVREVMSPDVIDRMPFPGQGQGVEGYCEKVAYIRTVFPDLSMAMDLMAAMDDLVVQSWTATATHSGADFLGIPASGRRITFKGIDVFRLSEGQIVELWHLEDFYSALVQLGAIAPPSSSPAERKAP